MADTSMMYWSQKLGKTQWRTVKFNFEITGAKASSQLPQGQPVLTAYDAIASQSDIDGFLGTSSEFTVAQFDATAMGDDAFACIVDMQGQVDELLAVTARCYSGTAGSTLVEQSFKAAGLTDSTLASEAALGANGNVAARIDFGNTPDFDGLTAGLIMVEFHYIAK